MKTLIILSAILSAALARPGVLLSPAYAPIASFAYAKLIPGAPIGLDGRVVDTPEVAVAKAEHVAAHIREQINLAIEAAKSSDQQVLARSSVVAPTVVAATGSQVVPAVTLTKLTEGAPLGPDGRVVDTPEVAFAKAEHAAAHVNEKISLAEAAARSTLGEDDRVILLAHPGSLIYHAAG